MAFSKAQFLQADDLAREEVRLPGGGSVFVRTLTVAELFDLQGRLEGRPKDAAAVLVAACLCDEAGALLFDSSDDGPALVAGKSPETVTALADAAMRLNKMGEAGADAAAKNSEASPPAGSPSASRQL